MSFVFLRCTRFWARRRDAPRSYLATEIRKSTQAKPSFSALALMGGQFIPSKKKHRKPFTWIKTCTGTKKNKNKGTPKTWYPAQDRKKYANLKKNIKHFVVERMALLKEKPMERWRPRSITPSPNLRVRRWCDQGCSTPTVGDTVVTAPREFSSSSASSSEPFLIH